MPKGPLTRPSATLSQQESELASTFILSSKGARETALIFFACSADMSAACLDVDGI